MIRIVHILCSDPHPPNLGGLIVPKVFQFSFIRSPVFIDFDEDFEVDWLGEEFFQSLAGLGGDLLQRHTLMPDDDALLRVTLHIDDRIDVDMLLVFLEPLHSRMISETKKRAGLSVSWSLSK